MAAIGLMDPDAAQISAYMRYKAAAGSYASGSGLYASGWPALWNLGVSD